MNSAHTTRTTKLCDADRLIFRSPLEIAAIENTGPPIGLAISTLTACACFATKPKVDYKHLHEFVVANAPIAIPPATILGSKIGGFAGQCSVVVRISDCRVINVKVFHNSSLQCTGIDVPTSGIECLRVIQKLVVMTKAIPASAVPTLRINDYRTVNINSTYKWHHQIKQPELFKILMKTYGLFVMFDTTHYPGINLKYFHNVHNAVQTGCCQCEAPCRGKGDGDRLMYCRRITVAIFRSGIVLITGSRNYTQLADVFDFIKNIFAKHSAQITAPTFSLEPTDD